MTTLDDAEAIDWSPTLAQWIGAVVGLLIGASNLFRDDIAVGSKAAFVVAYAVACAVIPRMRGVVRYRRVGQFSAHQLAMLAIAGGWFIEGDVAGGVVNGLWFLSAGAWWLSARRS